MARIFISGTKLELEAANTCDLGAHGGTTLYISHREESLTLSLVSGINDRFGDHAAFCIVLSCPVGRHWAQEPGCDSISYTGRTHAPELWDVCLGDERPHFILLLERQPFAPFGVRTRLSTLEAFGDDLFCAGGIPASRSIGCINQ